MGRTCKEPTAIFRSALIHFLKDLFKLGPGFALAGLRQGMTSGPISFPWRGKRWTVRGRDTDFATMREALRDGAFAIHAPMIAEQLQRRYRAILEAGQVPAILDLGANAGAASIWFAHEYPQAYIAAVEPLPATCEVLARNLAQIPGSALVPAAIGSRPGTAWLDTKWLAEGSWGVSTMRADGDAGEVPIRTVASILADIPGGVPFIIKCNIEGAEADLFAGALEWLDEAELVFMATHDDFMPDARPSAGFQQAMAQRPFRILPLGDQIAYVRDRGASGAS